jgi:hypothetical protein
MAGGEGNNPAKRGNVRPGSEAHNGHQCERRTQMPKTKDTKGKAAKAEEITQILEVSTGSFTACILGTTPLIHNRMSFKVAQGLLFPRKKTTHERATTLKHEPVEEFRASPYLLEDPKAGTYLAVRAAAFKGAMRAAALDMPGAKKAQIGRLVRVEGELVEVYGIPLLKMDVVRSADMNRTPDIRTRAAMREWACRITVTFVKPLIRAQMIANLLAASGMIDGIGDGRSEKGALDYGSFRICDEHDADYQRIRSEGDRAVQVAYFERPVAYDEETQRLWSWFEAERIQRALIGDVVPRVADEGDGEGADQEVMTQ